MDLTVEQAMPLHSSLTLGYVGNRANHLPIYIDTNIDPASVLNDARLSRIFPLFGDRYSFELAAEAFNLANHRNILSVNTNLVAYTAAGSGNCPALTTGNNGCLGPLSSSTAQFMSPSSTSNIIYGPRQLQLLGRFIF